MAMTPHETFAHALINEHGRRVFLQDHLSSLYFGGFPTRFWRYLLLAYGKRVYDLPTELGLEPTSETKPFAYPAYTLGQTLRLGIAPTEAIFYKTMGDYSRQFTPIHIGTAMLLYGAEQDYAEARRLLKVDFLKKVYVGRKASEFAGEIFINPHGPAAVGMKVFDEELLFDDATPYILDGIGNAAWFPDRYVTQVLNTTNNSHWYGHLIILNKLHQRWEKLLQATSYSKVHDWSSSKDYRDKTIQLRHCSPRGARTWMDKATGVSQILRIVRADSTPRDMATGLSTLFTADNSRTEKVLEYIGRPLTVEDFEAMTSKLALKTLYYAPFGAIADVVKTHSSALGAMLFTLTDRKYLPLLTECMLPRAGRPEWLPADHDLDVMGTQDVRWDENMKGAAEDYSAAKKWRDEFLQLAPPEILFMALLRWAHPEERDPLPHVAIDNMLRSWPNITQVQDMIKVMPIGQLSGL